MNNVSVDSLRAFSILFDGLTGEELSLVSEIVRLKTVKAGTLIISEGEIGEELFLLEDGTVDVSRTLTIVTSRTNFDTKERSFVRLTGTDHSFFGEMGLISRNKRTATVKAVTNCRLLVISAGDFQELGKSYPAIGYVVITNIARVLASHLQKTNDDVIKLSTALSLALSGS